MRSWLKRGADAVGAGLFAALFLTFIVQITARFGFNQPLPWTDELAVILYVWAILWAAAFMVPAKEHVGSTSSTTAWARARGAACCFSAAC
jgi:TRAP-type C4-dicarboxylate transport system permease small subunit